MSDEDQTTGNDPGDADTGPTSEDDTLARIEKGMDTLAEALGRVIAAQEAQEKRLSEVQEIATKATEAGFDVQAVDEEQPPGPVSLPKGTVRFYAEFKDYTIILDPTTVEKVGNRSIPVPGTSINFANGVYQTSDEGLIERLRSLPAYQREFFEGMAEPSFPKVQVTDGPKGSGGGRVEKPAELAAKL